MSIAAGPQPVLTLGRMLIARRFDGMFGQPYEIAAVAKTLNMPEDRFRFWPISEQPPLQSIYIACHRDSKASPGLPISNGCSRAMRAHVTRHKASTKAR